MAALRVISRQFSKITLTGLILVALFAFSTIPASAADGINRQINFQGKVVNSDGTNVADGNYDFEFTIYTTASGGSPVWTETRTGGNQVAVSGGIFRVSLGSVQSLPGSVDFNSDSIYLGVEFNNDGEMSPRIRFASVPYAFNAEMVNGLTVTNTSNNPFSSATALKLTDGQDVVFNAGLTFSGTNGTTFTFPSGSGTVVTNDSTVELTNKTIGSTGLVFSGATADITTVSSEDLALSANGSGNIVLTTSYLSGVRVGSSSNTPAVLSVSGGIGSNAALIVNQINGGADIIAASSSGTTRFVVDSSGNLAASGNVTVQGTTGLTLSGAGADITFTNLEQISNDTDGSIIFRRNDAGIVTLTAADNDSTAALSILSGGAAALTLDAGGSAALNLGTTNATSAVLGSSSLGSFTVTTDSTGNGEVVLPAQSIGAAEILDDTIDFGQIANSSTLDEDTAVSFSTLDLTLNLTSTGEFYIQDAGNNFAQFLADGTITLGKAASGGTLNFGVGSGADIISIGSDNTVGDTLTIGNNNSSSTLALTGGDDWSVTAAGAATFASLTGAGLSDCDASTSKLLWNDATGTFSCGTDMGSNLQVVDFTDTNTEVATFTTAMDIWDGTYPNITPGSTSSEILISVNIRGTSDDANDHNPVFIIRRAIGSDPVCTGGSPSTAVGGEFVGGFLTTATQDWGASVTTSDAPASTGNVRYTVCTTTTGADDGNTDEVRIVLTEIGSASAGGGGNVAVRETDSSPSVASASTIEFGPATTSSDEFVVTDEGSGVARIRIGDQVGILNQAETVTGGWVFSTAATTFTTAVNANGGLTTTTADQNLALSVNGAGDFVANIDFDSGFLIGAASNTPAPLSVSGGLGSNAAFIVNQTNNGNIIAASSSGTTRFVVDSNGNLETAGSVNLSTGNLAFSSSGGITLTGGTISDATDEVDINDDLAVAGNISLTGSTGLTFTGSGADITFTNLEQISNDTNGTLTLGRNDSGTVTLNARDDDATAALSILSGGAAALTLDTGDAATINIGNTNANSLIFGNTGSSTSLTFTKGASGDITLTGFNCSTLTNGGVLTTDENGVIECQNDDGGAATATYWDSSFGALFPNNSTYDVFFGGTATQSAKFGFLNTNNGGTPTATISATSTGNALILDANGNVRTTQAQRLTLGGGDSGEVYTASLLRIDSTLGVRGGGLSDCDNPATAKLLWDDTTNRFSCGTDQGGGEGSSMTVRESDSSPAVSAVAVLEFGPGSVSADEFIVTDEGSGIARVRIGNQVGLLNEAETVTGGWTFNTAATTFTTAVNANGGLTTTTTDQDLNLSVNGSGDFVFGIDHNSGLLIGSTANTPAPLSVSGGYGSNAAFIVNQANNGNIIAASASGQTRFVVDSSGNIQLFGGTISDGTDGVDINDDLDVSGAINLSTGNIVYSSTGGISLAGGTISDSVGSVLINDNVSVAGTTGLTFSSTGGISLAGGTISDSSDGVDINDDLEVAGTTGITLTGTGADLIFANNESITNDTNGTITLKRNDAGTVILNAADDDSTAALTINSGGAAALTLDTGGGAALSVGNANATSVTIGNTANGFGVTINTGTGTLNLGDVATTKAIEIGGVDNDGGDTVRIATNATSADSINIGNANSGTTIGITGGDDWSITNAGLATFTKLAGAGLSDCDTAATSKLLWDSTNQTFSCGTDAGVQDVVHITDAGDTSWADNNTTELWDGATQPNITPSSSTNDLLIMVTVIADINPSNNGSSLPIARIDREIGSVADCTDVDTVGSTFGFGEYDNQSYINKVATYTFVDAPGTTSNVSYTVCTSADSVLSGTNTENRIEFTIIEVNDTQAADFAEIYPTNDSTLSAGEVVSLDPEMQTGAMRSQRAYDSRVIGIVSTRPAITIGGANGESDNAVPIALSGRVPVKVTSENGGIKPGDYLTSSSIPGVAMRSTKAGVIIGQAFGSYDGEGIGEVMVFVNTSTSNGASLADVIPGISNNQTTDEQAKIALSEFVNRKDHTDIDLSEIYTDRLAAGLEIITPRVVSDEVKTNIVTAVDEDVSVVLSEGKFRIGSEPLSSSIVFDSEGNATFSGTLTAEKIKAGQIEFDGISFESEFENKYSAALLDLDSKIATISARVSDIENWNLKALSSSSSSDMVFTENLMVAGSTTLAEVSILDRVAIGNSLFIDGSSINTLGTPLEIQPLAQGNINFMGGKIVFDTQGNVEIAGKILGESAKFKDLEAGKISVSRFSIEQISDTQIQSSASAGLIKINAENNFVELKNPLISKDSLIYLTPKNSRANVYIDEQEEGRAVFKADKTGAVDINFLIVNLRD